MAADGTQQAVKIGELIRKAASDKELKARLIKDSASVFKDNGISIPAEMTVKVMEDTNTLYHFIVPPAPEKTAKSSNMKEVVTSDGSVGQLMARALTDNTFRKALIADTMKVLKEHGVGAPEGVTIKALEDTGKVTHLVIPMARTGELSDADLDMVAGGKSGGCYSNDAYTVNVCWPIADGIGKAKNALGMCNSMYWGNDNKPSSH